MTKKICPWHLSGCPELTELEKASCRQWKVLRQIIDERHRQDDEWGDQSHHSNEKWLAILMEEVGEIAKAILGDEDWRDEAVQSAAVLVAWLEVREVPAND